MRKAGHRKWKMILIPLSWIYGLVVWIRNTCYDHNIFKSSSFSLPVISVGNIAVGGSGKTPHVEYLAGLLSDTYRVATLSRGYRRKTRDFQVASSQSGFREVGDEPLQIKRRFPRITVAVDRKRVHGVEELLKIKPSVEVILLDDAFQHRALKAGLSILLMDYQQAMSRDYLLPAGMLREPLSNRTRAQIILITRTPEELKPIGRRTFVNRMDLSLGQHLFFTAMRYGELLPLFPDTPQHDETWFKERVAGVLIVSGIAKPWTLRSYAQGIHQNIRELRFPDHHDYRPRDLDKISHVYREMGKEGKMVLVLTTEKDAVRLNGSELDEDLRKALYAVRIRVHFLNDDEEAFHKLIFDYVNSNKRSSILYQETNR